MKKCRINPRVSITGLVRSSWVLFLASQPEEVLASLNFTLGGRPVKFGGQNVSIQGVKP